MRPLSTRLRKAIISAQLAEDSEALTPAWLCRQEHPTCQAVGDGGSPCLALLPFCAAKSCETSGSCPVSSSRLCPIAATSKGLQICNGPGRMPWGLLAFRTGEVWSMRGQGRRNTVQGTSPAIIPGLLKGAEVPASGVLRWQTGGQSSRLRSTPAALCGLEQGA